MGLLLFHADVKDFKVLMENWTSVITCFYVNYGGELKWVNGNVCGQKGLTK